jgi:hypothetical protein
MSTIRFGVWNMEWMNDLFTDGPAFKADNARVRGPNPTMGRDEPTVRHRRDSLSGVIDDIDLDALMVVEGPNKASELQLFFDTDVTGTWVCDVQPTKGGSQIIGLAVRTDKGLFADNPFERFHIGKGQGGESERLSKATDDFVFDTDDDEIQELHKFERNPLYAEIRLSDGKRFRVVGLHLKSKGIFKSYEWLKWWSRADANRKKIIAQCTRLRMQFLDHYLTEDATKAIPLIICGDINDGPGQDASERRIGASGIERLMGTVWKPALCLGNALYDALDPDDRWAIDLSSIYTTSFRDPIFHTYLKVWIDHILYSRNRPGPWIGKGRVHHLMSDGKKMWEKYPFASDHFPVTVEIDTDGL